MPFKPGHYEQTGRSRRSTDKRRRHDSFVSPNRVASQRFSTWMKRITRRPVRAVNAYSR